MYVWADVLSAIAQRPSVCRDLENYYETINFNDQK